MILTHEQEKDNKFAKKLWFSRTIVTDDTQKVKTEISFKKWIVTINT